MPPFDVSTDWTRPVVKRPLKSLQQVTDTSAQERHSLEIGSGDFTRLSPPDRADIQRIYAPED